MPRISLCLGWFYLKYDRLHEFTRKFTSETRDWKEKEKEKKKRRKFGNFLQHKINHDLVTIFSFWSRMVGDEKFSCVDLPVKEDIYL